MRTCSCFLFCVLLTACGGSESNQTATTPVVVIPEVPEPEPIPDPVPEPSPEQSGILVFSKTNGFRHDSISAGQAMLQALATKNNWPLTTTEDANMFTDSTLEAYSVVVWLNTTGDVLNTAQQSAFESFIESGGGYVGIHAASDTEYSWPWYGELVGAYFTAHPQIQNAQLLVEDQTHLSTYHLTSNWQRTDEWYNFQQNPRSNVNVLLSLDEDSYDPGSGAMGDHPIAWYKHIGQGRSFYSGLGHTIASYSEDEFIQHIEGGIAWAGNLNLADLAWQGDAPSDEQFSTKVLASSINQPQELDISKAGEIYVIGRMGEFYAMVDDTLSQTSSIQVNSVQEGGLIGFALDPDFANNRFAYFHYTHPSLSQHNVSRIPINPDHSLDLDSEVIVLTYPVQLSECCHTAGSLAFDNVGNLYIATGDNTNPFNSDGYTPIDEQAGRSAWDAQKSSSNSNDLRGKILRILPTADGGYQIPAGNLFNESAEHRAEIYTMGHRNPYRITIDSATNNLVWADIGPDAGSSNPNRGPSGVDEINQTLVSGNFGWPYFTGNNAPYNDFDFATRTSGNPFNPENVLNDSPNNTGATELPNTIPAWITLSHRALMVADVYRFNPAIQDEHKLPSYFHGKLLYWNFNNDRMFEASVGQDTPNLRQWLDTSVMAGIIDGKISPQNNRLYLISFGGNCCGKPNDAGLLVEVNYTGDGNNGGQSGDPTLPESPFPSNTAILLIAAANGQYLGKNPDTQSLSALFEQAMGEQTFIVEEDLDGYIRLRALADNQYITLLEDDSLGFSPAGAADSSLFLLVANENGSFSLQAKTNDLFVQWDNNNQTLTASAGSATLQTELGISVAEPCEIGSGFAIECRPNAKPYLDMPIMHNDDFSNVPTLLSETGAFTNTIDMTPSNSLIPYQPIATLWSDRAEKLRWVSIPSGEKVIWDENDKWQWPAGTVFIKHFSLPTDVNNPDILKRLETRLIVMQETGLMYGVTYKWRDDNSDAELLTTSISEELDVVLTSGAQTQTWVYPSPGDCLSCHNQEAKGVLGVKTAALNSDYVFPSGLAHNQLATWNNLNLFAEPLDNNAISNYPAHANIGDSSKTLEHRVRSYWDINCASCHGPQGIAALWDARYATALTEQGVIYGDLANQRDYLADYGLTTPYVVEPKNVDNSILYIRDKSMNIEDRMPPLGRQLEDQEYIQVLTDWINSLEQ
jgi:uncharacterized repeat protein (TIGR03806 family)